VKFNLVIVEDEESIALRIKNYINSNFSNSFNVVDTFSNGYDALLSLNDIDFNLVITDINMPYINGLDLIKSIKEDYPLVKFLIISGYDDKEYLKEAINLGVIGYLTKPIDYNELSEYLNKANYILINELDKLKEDASKIDEKYILEEDNLDDLANKINLDDNSFKSDSIVFSLLDFDDEKELIIDENKKILTNIIPFYLKKEKDNFANYEVFKYKESFIIIYFVNKETNNQNINLNLKTLITYLKKNYNLDVSLSYLIIEDLKKDINFNKMYKRCIKAINYRLFLGKNSLIFYDDICKFKNVKELDPIYISDLVYELKYGTLNKCANKLSLFIKEIEDLKSHELYEFYINNLVNELINSCYDKSKLFTLYNSYSEIIYNLFNIKNNENVYKYVFELMNRIYEINKSHKEDDILKSYNQILTFINNNYSNSSFNLDDVSKELNYSNSYISLILKNNGKSFVKVLTDIRMKKALDLLNNPQNKISSIASLVGYDDPFYFSHVFKKYYKKSPLEYRNNEKNIN